MIIKEDLLGKRSKRGKTFTGCWTCRSRKVKCDLRRPNCERCEKSGLVCGGYDIKLRWSRPVNFDIYGNQVHGANSATASSNESADEPQYRRRNIEFVRYRKEYEYYEDMDEELTALLNPAPERVSNNKTWIIEKFGVFRGIENLEGASDRPRRKRKKTNADDKKTVIASANESSELLGNDDFAMSFPSASNHEWISNELRDDALLSAAALQGFPLANIQLSSASSLDELGSYEIGGAVNGRSADDDTDDAILQQALQVLFHRASPVNGAEVEVKLLQQMNSREKESPGDLLHERGSFVPFENEIKLDCSDLGSKMPLTVMEVVPSLVPDSKIFNLSTSSSPLLRLPTTGLHVHGLTRFLLNYYKKNVADLMTVVTLSTNPWKTLYFPRALKAIGDLAGLGYTSNSRNSLLNALLAVSCFNLKSKFDKNSAEAQFFLNHGIEFRKQASNFLKVCLGSTVSKERYKDVLTAILSMNSIDVVWGTMADCQHHLAICEDFIENRMRSRPKISEKAKALHRIFSFLKLIQDSTALDKVREKEIAIKDSPDEYHKENSDQIADQENEENMTQSLDSHDGKFRESLNRTDGKIQIEFVKNSSLAPSSSGGTPIFNNIASETYFSSSPSNPNTDILSTDALYGLPNSLILLFSDCVRLVRHNEYYNMNNMPLPRQFTKICLKYEKRLLKWNPEWQFYKSNTKEFENDTIEGVYHHTMSFYNSLIIYYFTMARNLDYQFLQSYVGKVLYHLKTLSDLIQFKNVKIVPLVWQGFIAGCASIDTEIQDEFRKWAATLASNGMGSYWGARQVMFEVWRRRHNEEPGDRWYSVYKDWEMNLMLS